MRRHADRAEFTTPEVARIAGISYRQIDYWCRQGYLNPSLEAANGSGTSRRFSLDDVLEAVILGRLSALGISPGSLDRSPSQMIDYLLEELETLRLEAVG